MRIAIVSEGWFPEVSGVTIAAEQHLRHLAARGHELLLVHPRYPADALARMGTRTAPDAPGERFAFDSDPIAPHRPETRVPSPSGAREVDAAIERFKPAAVIYKNPDRLVPEISKPWKPRRVAGLLGARAAGAKVAPIIHTLLPLFVERSGSWIWRTPPAAALTRRIWSGIYNDHFDFAVTVDAAARDYIESVGVRVPVLAGPWNGVDTALFSPPPEAPKRDRPLRLCWIGRLVPEKNAPLLPRLVGAMRARGLAFELVVIGDGPLAATLRRDLPEGSGVTFRGWLGPEAVATELARSDLYLSLSDTESYSLTASEALASGVPVIAPDVIGFKRLAAMDVGRLFPAAWLTAEGMGEVAGVVASSPPRLDAWAARARLEAPRLSWGVALDAMYAALGARMGLDFVA